MSEALQTLPLESMQGYQKHAQAFQELQNKKEEIRKEARTHLQELATLFSSYKENLSRGTTSIQTITQERENVAQQVEEIDRIYDQYLHSIKNLAENSGVHFQADIDTLHSHFEQTILNSLQSLIAAHAPAKATQQTPSIHLTKGLSSADEEYAAHVATLFLRFADIEIAEEKHWNKVKKMDKRLQTFYRFALPLNENDSGYQPLTEEYHFLKETQSRMFTYIQELIETHESSPSLPSETFAAIDKKIQKILGPEQYKTIYQECLNNHDLLLESSRYAPLVQDQNLKKRIILFEEFDRQVQEQQQHITEEINIRKDSTKSPLHLFFELMYPKIRDPLANLFIETGTGERVNLSTHTIEQTRHNNNLGAFPLFSDYGYPESHYIKDKKTNQLSHSQYFIDLRRLAQVTYFMLTTSHRWLSVSNVTDKYIEDFRAHKLQAPYNECDRIADEIGRLTSQNEHDPHIDALERRRDQLIREIKKYDNETPPGIHFTPVQRAYFHITKHLRPENQIRYRILHPMMDENQSKLRIYDKNFRDIRNKIEDRLTLRNVYTKGRIPETDLRLLTETLRQYI